MLQSKTNINTLKKDIDSIKLSETSSRAPYGDLFYYHITSLIKFKLLSQHNNVDELKLTEKNYLGLEQYIFEHTQLVENENPQKIDWDLIDNAKEILKNKIQRLLGPEGKSHHLKPILSFTLDSYENWLMYFQLHPESVSNPWIPTNSIMHKGYLFLVTDNQDVIESYDKKIYKSVSAEFRGNVGVVAKGEKNKFSGFLVDNRSRLQGLVYEYLKLEGSGVSNVKNITAIRKFLSQQKYYLTDNEIRNKILIPLKRSGLIGSLTTGFYFINDLHDLIHAYTHHKEKLRGIQRTLNMYQEKATKMGWGDLDKI